MADAWIRLPVRLSSDCYAPARSKKNKPGDTAIVSSGDAPVFQFGRLRADKLAGGNYGLAGQY
jgi:hypothetical protein